MVISIGSKFFALGVAIGFILPTFFVDVEIDKNDIEKSKNQVFRSLFLQAIVGLVIGLLTITTLPGEPNLPPSANATIPRDDDIIGTIRILVTNRQFLKLSISFGFYFSVLLVLMIIIDEILEKFGFECKQAGMVGSLGVLGGFLGLFLYGIILK